MTGQSFCLMQPRALLFCLLVLSFHSTFFFILSLSQWNFKLIKIKAGAQMQGLQGLERLLGGQAAPTPGQDIPTPDSAEVVHISSLALLKVF